MQTVYDDNNIETKYLLVKICSNYYAFSISAIQEVIPMIEIFSLESYSNTLGVINLRGESIPVANFMGFLKKENFQITSKQKILVLKLNSDKVAIIVDELDNIVDIPGENLVQIPAPGDFLKTAAINDKSVAVIDIYAFYKFFAASPYHEVVEGNLVPVENSSLPAIKNHTEIINKSDSYLLSQDSFLNEKFIIFRLDKEIYAFNILHVEEIKKITSDDISTVPCVPEFIRGIINVDGDYLSIIDIKPFLNLKLQDLKEKFDVVIVKVNDMKVAIIVDEIINIDTLSTPKMVSSELYADSFIKGEITEYGMIINMLDIEKLFSSHNVDIENYYLE